MSRHFKVELSTGVIDIYDGYVPWRIRDRTVDWLSKDCGWFLGWDDGTGKDPHLHAVVTEAMPTTHDIIACVSDDERFKERTKGHRLGMTVANLSHAASIHHRHTHPQQLGMLYYANLEWEHGWEGETFFYDQEGEVEYCNIYVPGRIILFDSQMCHSIRSQSHIGPPARFTVSYFWDYVGEQNEEMVENLGEESGGEGRGD